MWRSTGWHLLLMLDGKDTLLHILAWKRSVLRREIENVSINESHSANESHISTLHSAQTSAVLYLWTNRSLEDGASGSVNRQWNQFRLWLQGVFFNVQKKGLRACVRDTVRKWSHIIYFLLQYMVLYLYGDASFSYVWHCSTSYFSSDFVFPQLCVKPYLHFLHCLLLCLFDSFDQISYQKWLLKHNTSLWVEQVCYKVCVWPLQDDLEQKWDIKMTVTSKWFPPIKFPLLSHSIIISLISATLCRQRRGSGLHPSTDELHFKFITSGMKKKKNINKKERSFRKY